MLRILIIMSMYMMVNASFYDNYVCISEKCYSYDFYKDYDNELINYNFLNFIVLLWMFTWIFDIIYKQIPYL